MNADDVARERRLDAFLGEAVGGTPSCLEQRILQRLSASPARARQGQLLAALLMLGGIAVVVAVAVLQHRDGAMAQEPQGKDVPIVAVTTADVEQATSCDIPAGRDVVDALRDACGWVGVEVVIAGDVMGKVSAAMPKPFWREAVATLARDAGAGVEEVGPILLVRRTMRSLPYAARVTLGATQIDLRDFAKVIATKAGVDLVVSGDLCGRVSCDLELVSWRDALELVTRRAGGEVVGCGTVLVLRPRIAAKPPAPPRANISFSQTRQPIADLVEFMASKCGLNVVLNPGLGTVTASVTGANPQDVLQALARADHASLHHEDRGIYRLEKREPPMQQPVLLTAENVDLRTFAELLHSATQATIPVPEDSKAKLSVFAKGAPLADLLAAAALATGHKLVDDDKGGLRIE